VSRIKLQETRIVYDGMFAPETAQHTPPDCDIAVMLLAAEMQSAQCFA
jgi:hypothetical protein